MSTWWDSRGCSAHLIWAGLGAAPVEQHLLDGVCVGHTEAGGALDLVYLGDCLICRAERKSQVCVNIYMLWCAPSSFFGSDASLFILTRRPPSPASQSWLCGPAWLRSSAESEPSSAPCVSPPAFGPRLPSHRCVKMCRPRDQKHWSRDVWS